MHLKINLKATLFYCAYALALIALNCVLPRVQFSLGLCFATLACGANIIITPLLYIITSAVSLDWITTLLSIFESGFLTAVTFIYRRSGRKIRAEAAAYMCIALAPFIAFSRWQGIDSLYITRNVYIIKSIAAFAVIIFTFFAFRTTYSVMFRLYRCRLRPDELLCICVFAAVVGTGVCNLCRSSAYICIALAVCACAVRLFKTPSAIIVALVVAVPLSISLLQLSPLTVFILITLFALICRPMGRFAPAFACSSGGALYLYACGLYANATQGALYTLLLVACTLTSAIPSEKHVEETLSNLAVKKVLPRAEEERLKEYLSEKLYKLSEAFREVEQAFFSLDEGPDDGAMKKRMLAEIKKSTCTDCRNRKQCERTSVYRGVASLIEIGCVKGKVSFVDLTSDITLNCSDPTTLTDNVNRLLAEYRRTTLEAENARCGRRLLAGQARGIAEVLKSRAVEFCRTQPDYAAAEKKIESCFAANGISCPEVRISGEYSRLVSVTLADCAYSPHIKGLIEECTGFKLMLKDKIVYDAHKTAFIFAEPPKYDAAFGVAFAVKDGERVSGDTHSVIKINEHSFLMALSDGMGSGKYAQKVSSTAISLIEAFCRAEMPTEIVLDTINKLLCFNRDERFTCIDAAQINLNTLSAGFIKIGSPVAIIVRKGEIKVLESHSLPMGILDVLHPTTCTEQLKNNDIIVFMSDGITSSFNGVADLYDYLSTLKPLNPQSLAEKILSAAKERTLGTPDDMTVLCVRIFERT